jgi:hypothetical protein
MLKVMIRHRVPDDHDQAADFLDRHHSLRVARLGELLHPLRHPALLALDDGRIVAVATYVVRSDAVEILTLHSDRRCPASAPTWSRLSRRSRCREAAGGSGW